MSAPVVTARAVAVGLAVSAGIVVINQIVSLRYSAAELSSSAPPPLPLVLLALYALTVGPWLTRRGGFSRGEVLLVYAMALLAGPIADQQSTGFLLPHLVAARHFAPQEPTWAPFLPFLPAWFGPTDPAAVEGFFRGGPVPWRAWIVPLVSWSALLVALLVVMLCLNALMHRPWVEQERLTFPLTVIPLALTDLSRDRPLRQPLFWIGVAIPLAFQALSRLHLYFPQVPDLQLKDRPLFDAGEVLPSPWRGIGPVDLYLNFWLIGVAYLLPREITLSALVFYGVRLLENVAAVAWGTTGTAPDVYSNDFPAIFSQGAGAAFALAGISVWSARRHLAAAGRSAFRRGPTDREEFLSARVAVWGALLGTAFLVVWIMAGSARWWFALLIVALLLCYFFVFARVRAEAGLGMGVIVWPQMLDSVVLTLTGTRDLRLSELTVLFSLRWLYFGSATGSVMAAQMEGFKLAGSAGLRGSRVGGALLAAGLLALPLALYGALTLYYRHGFSNLPIGQGRGGFVSSQIFWSFGNLAASQSTPVGPDGDGIAAMGAGALVTLAMSVLRARFLWFALNPVGYMVANSWGMHWNWAPFLIGWGLNRIMNHYGGLLLYRRALPLIFGVIVGDMFHETLWGIIAWLTGGTS